MPRPEDDPADDGITDIDGAAGGAPAVADLNVPAAVAGDLTATPYDRDRKQDADRAWISFVLLGMLSVIVLFGFVMCFWALSPTDSIDNNLKTVTAFLNIVFGPIVTLVGSATGFYFGTRTAGSKPG